MEAMSTDVEEFSIQDKDQIEDQDEGPSKAKRPKITEETRIVKLNAVNLAMCNVYDRTGVSDRKATMLTAETLKNLIDQLIPALVGPNSHIKIDLSLSRSSVYRFRNKARKELGEAYDKVTNGIKVKVVLQWDGKQYTENHAKIERVVVLVVGDGVDQLLGVLPLHSATGKNQADGILDLLAAEYNLKAQIVGMCFDTCRTNTGAQKGTCVLIEQGLGKELLRLACRHHIFEIILKAAFIKALSLDDQSPEVLLFKNFKNNIWITLDKENYKSCLDDPEVSKEVKNKQNNLLQFSMDFLKVIMSY